MKYRAPKLKNLRKIDFPPRDFLIEPWLRDSESAMIYAPAGVGKSMFALSLTLAIAGGGEFLGWKASAPRQVLFVDGEMHITDVVSRTELLLKAMNGIDPDVAGDNTIVMARQYQNPGVSFPDLAEQRGRDEMLRIARNGVNGEKPFDLVILDNLSTLASVKDENSASEFNDVIKFLMHLKQAGIACILVHHTGKNGKTYRGSSKLATTFEVMIGLSKLKNSMLDHGTAFTMTWDKFRGKRDDTTVGQDVWLTEDKDGNPKWEYSLSQDEEAEAIVQLLRTLEYTTQEELAKALPFSCSTGKLSKLKYHCFSLGLITERDWDECMSLARKRRTELGEPEYSFDEDLEDF